MKVIKISFLIIGSIIGAGFASGKEINQYFAIYGLNCLYLLPILFLAFLLCIFLLLKIGQKTQIKYIDELNCTLFKNKKLINLFTFLTFLILNSAMFSGILELIKIYLPNSNFILSYIICILITILLSNININLFTYLSLIIVPFIIILIGINDCYMIKSFNNITTFSSSIVSIFMPLLYVFQNIFLSSFVIAKSAKKITNMQCVLIAILTSTILTLLIGLSCVALLKSNYGVYEIPFAKSSINFSKSFGYIYGIVLLLSIITTYISTLTTYKEFFNGNKCYEKRYFMIITIAVLGFFDFSFIVGYLYPLIGCFGFVYIIFCYKFLHRRKQEKYQLIRQS